MGNQIICPIGFRPPISWGFSNNIEQHSVDTKDVRQSHGQPFSFHGRTDTSFGWARSPYIRPAINPRDWHTGVSSDRHVFFGQDGSSEGFLLVDLCIDGSKSPATSCNKPCDEVL